MPTVLNDIFGLLGYLLAAIGFGAFGFGAVRFMLDTYPKAIWQVQIALVLGLFGLFVGLTDFASPGSAGAFALGAGAAFLMATAFFKKPEHKDATPVKPVETPEAAPVMAVETREATPVKKFDADATIVADSSRK
jgi:hypothetical protein